MSAPRLKAWARTALRPLVRRLDHRLEQRMLQAHGIGGRVARLEAELADARDIIERQRAAVPALLDAVSTQHSAVRHARRQEAAMWDSITRAEQRLAAVEQRVEHARKELLFELRYGGRDRGVLDAVVEPKVLNPDKVERMGGDLRLNLGSGAFAVEGYLNVDVREIEGVVDVVAELHNLPFEPGSVSEMFSSHVLEHFPEEELVRRLLPYWVGLLKPGGRFRAVVPDAEAMMRAWNEGRMTFEEIRTVTFGEQEYEGDFHFTMFTPDSLAAHLEQAGLTDVEVVAQGRRNGLCFEMELQARRA